MFFNKKPRLNSQIMITLDLLTSRAFERVARASESSGPTTPHQKTK